MKGRGPSLSFHPSSFNLHPLDKDRGQTMTHLNITGGHRLTGRCQVPGDKSISHRAVMFSAIANGTSTVRNFLDGGDCRATIEVMRGLGIKIEERAPTELVIHGRGLDGLQEPAEFLNVGNSGTTIRLMTGLLA